MTMDTLYLIRIPSGELELIKRFLSNRRGEIPNLWKQLTAKPGEMYLNSYQNGFMTGALYSIRYKVPECWKQLIDLQYENFKVYKGKK
jgi:hypothetical protein